MYKSNRIYYAFFGCSLLFTLVYLAINRSSDLASFFYEGGVNLFGDFTNNLHYPTHQQGPYFDSIWATFPPLAYTFYYLINVCYTRAIYHVEILAYLIITAISCILMLYAIIRLFKRYGKNQNQLTEPLLLTCCLLLSGVMVYAIERGNSVFNVLIMLLLALDFKESDNKLQKELALILIAVAANFKLYPAIFGVIYLLEKRYKEALRLLVYGILFFVVPFAWFGGVEGFVRFMQNQQAIHDSIRTNFFTSIPSIATYFSEVFSLNSEHMLTIGQLVATIFAVVFVACIILEKRLWLRVLHIVCLFIVVPGWSAEYMAIYMALPLVLLLCNDARYRKLYLVLFAGVFILLPIRASFTTHATISWNIFISFGSIYALSFLGIFDTFNNSLKQRKIKKGM